MSDASRKRSCGACGLRPTPHGARAVRALARRGAVRLASGYPLNVFPPPEWLVYATPTIALLAMLTALASLAVARATYRRAGPHVRVDFEVGTFSDPRVVGRLNEVPGIIIHVTNRGMVPVGLNDFMLRPPSMLKLLRDGPHLLFEDFDVEVLDGEHLPIVVPPSTTMDWAYRVKSAGMDSHRVTDLTGIYERIRQSTLEVRLGNGRKVKRTIRTFGAIVTLGDLESSRLDAIRAAPGRVRVRDRTLLSRLRTIAGYK